MVAYAAEFFRWFSEEAVLGADAVRTRFADLPRTSAAEVLQKLPHAAG